MDKSIGFILGFFIALFCFYVFMKIDNYIEYKQWISETRGRE